MRFTLVLLLAGFGVHAALAEEGYVVHATDVADRKAVITTVEPIHQLVARATTAVSPKASPCVRR